MCAIYDGTIDVYRSDDICFSSKKIRRRVNQLRACGVEMSVDMGNTVENPGDLDRQTEWARTDWPAMLRLAMVAGVFAALAAVALSGVVAETTIVVCVIVAGTMASWFQIEHQRPAPRGVRVRRN